MIGKEKITMKEVWQLQLAEYFISSHGYVPVMVREDPDNLWMISRQGSEYPVLCISLSGFEKAQFSESRMNSIADAISSQLHVTNKRLELYPGETGEPEEFNGGSRYAIPMGWQPQEKLKDLYPGLSGNFFNDPSRISEKYMELIRKINRGAPAQRAGGRADGRTAKRPAITWGIMILCSLVYLAASLIAYYTKAGSVNIAILMGAFYRPFVIGLNDWWRLLTAGFMHGSIWHLLTNMLALYYIGANVERIYGWKKYLLILLGSVFAGFLFVLISGEETVSVGLSGGLFGCLGAVAVYFVHSGLWNNPEVRRRLISVLLINIAISMMPGISWRGHLGGFAFGTFTSLLMTDEPKWKKFQVQFRIAGVILIAIIIVFCLRVHLTQIYPGTDQEVCKLAKSLHLDLYARHINRIWDYYMRAGLITGG